jgi:HEAT repeat protein
MAGDLEALQQQLDDPNPKVQLAAAQALEQQDPTRMVPRVLDRMRNIRADAYFQRLDDRRHGVRFDAARAWEQLDQKDPTRPFPDDRRNKVQEVLDGSLLQQQLGDLNPEVQLAAAQALEQHYMERLSLPVRWRVFEIVDGRQLLQQQLDDPDPEVQLAAAQALEQQYMERLPLLVRWRVFEIVDGRQLLQQQLDDLNPEVQLAAAQALEQQDPTRMAPRVRDRMQNILEPQ